MRHPVSVRRIGDYLLAVLAVALTTAFANELRDYLNAPTVALLYLLPVGLSAATGGLGAGVTASFCAFLALNYYFVTPLYELGVRHGQDVLALAVFLVMTLMISELVNRARSSLAEAKAREREALHLYELSTALAGLRSADAIGRVVAERLQEILQAQEVEVLVQPEFGAASEALQAPEGSPAPARRPEHLIPLLTGRGLLGEIRVWQRQPAADAAEERLLHTFATQCSLALERAALMQTETRARVLEESDTLKSALLSSVSHELRTPLATIKAGVSSLRSRTVAWDSPAGRDLLAAMEEEVDHLNRLVGNVLDMSRIEAGALKPQRQWNILRDILDTTLTRMRLATERHHIAIDMPEDLPLVPVDAMQMEQVFTNLIDNSLKYAPPGTTIEVRARQESEQVLRVQVTNEGPPVAPEHLEHIFDKFHRVTEADRVTGTGLGLSICKGIIAAHGGTIWAENLPGGFAFNFTLPLEWNGARPPRLPLEVESP